jgi:hypothetical protein
MPVGSTNEGTDLIARAETLRLRTFECVGEPAQIALLAVSLRG